jgi:hypothetical protein
MRIYFVLGVLILLTLSSCLTILQSLVTPDNIITDNRIEGLWIDSGSKSILVQKLMSSEFKNVFTEAVFKPGKYTAKDSVFYIKHYVISFRERDLSYTWTAGMVKIKNQYYLNLEPEQCLNNNGVEVYKLNDQNTSSIAKLEWKNNNSLVLYFLNGDYIKEIVLKGLARIKYEYDPLFDTFMITASPGEIEQFLEKYGSNESLFRGGNTIILTRKI